MVRPSHSAERIIPDSRRNPPIPPARARQPLRQYPRKGTSRQHPSSSDIIPTSTMSSLRQPHAALIIGMHNCLREPYTGKGTTFFRYGQWTISDQFPESRYVLCGFAPPCHSRHNRPPARNGILQSPQGEAVAVDRVGDDTYLNEMVDQGGRPRYPQALIDDQHTVIMKFAIQPPRHGVLSLALGKVRYPRADGEALRSSVRPDAPCGRP